MGDFTMGAIGGLFSGLLIALWATHREHRYAQIRDEWNAGTKLRGLLNELIEMRRRALERPTLGHAEFFVRANSAFQGGPALVDQMDSAINEFMDFLPLDDQTEFAKLWSSVRSDLTNHGSNAKLRMTTLAAAPPCMTDDAMKSSLEMIGTQVPRLKSFTLKRRNSTSQFGF